MEINLKNAVKYFFPRPSLEMVYFESVANAIDANSSEIDITIKLDSFANYTTLNLLVIDNGEGFTNERFKKFSKLLEVEGEDHKGVGRLVFLNYFDKIEFLSSYANLTRSFILSGTFKGENKVKENTTGHQGTEVNFKSYSKGKINSYDYVKPDSIKKALLLHFFPLFYSLKIKKKQLRIGIKLETREPNLDQGFFTDSREILVSEIPELTKLTFKAEEIDLFEDLNLYYSIKENQQDTNIITALSVDGRSIQMDLLSKGGIPVGYEIIFILYSKIFKGKTSASRQELNMSEGELRAIK